MPIKWDYGASKLSTIASVRFEKCTSDPKVENFQMSETAEMIYKAAKKRDPDQKEFLQAVKEVVETLEPVFAKDPSYAKVMMRILEPERMLMFRVPWIDDKGEIQVNRGFRVQFNSALGPYKGGLRFHPSVNLSIVKFLGFEQIFKNALTGLNLGGGKGGSDFDPKGKSEAEIMRFCQSFMTELHNYIGADRDVPAGDIGVGGKEIGYLFGQFKRIRGGQFQGVLTGKNPLWGGSLIRPEATGYGAVYFAVNALEGLGKKMDGMRCLLSGSGNVAQYCAQKCIQMGGVVLSLSDSKGTIVEPNGFTNEQLQWIIDLKQKSRRARVKEYMDSVVRSLDAQFYEGKRPWGLAKADLAFPCATQNEVNEENAKDLVKNGVTGVFEAANMPCTEQAIAFFKESKVTFGPAKAVNAGGVGVSGLEMAQNAAFTSWGREEVDEKLQVMMKNIYTSSMTAAKNFGCDLQAGANIAGFLKVAEAMKQQGL